MCGWECGANSWMSYANLRGGCVEGRVCGTGDQGFGFGRVEMGREAMDGLESKVKCVNMSANGWRHRK